MVMDNFLIPTTTLFAEEFGVKVRYKATDSTWSLEGHSIKLFGKKAGFQLLND
jgi:hypothetical protein